MSSRVSGATVALTVAVVAALALSLGSALPVVSGGTRGFASAALLIALAVVPVAVAVILTLRGRAGAAAGVLAGLAALAPGRVLGDLQFAVDASVLSRPALYMPRTLDSPSPAAGLWLLVAGQVALLVAGVFAVRGLPHADGPAAGAWDEFSSPGQGRVPMLVAVCLAGAAGIGSLLAPFASGDAYLLAHGALDSGPLTLAGSLLFAGALPVAAVMAAGSVRTSFARGCLGGLGLGALAVSVPRLVAVVAMPAVSLRPGPVIVVVAAAGLLSTAALLRAAPVPEVTQQDGGGGTSVTADRAVTARVPGVRRFELAISLVALLTCAAAVTGSLTARVTSALGGPSDIDVRWPLLVAGLLVAGVGLVLLIPRAAPTARPVMSVLWAAVPVAGISVLDAGLAAGETGGVLTPGPGTLWTVVAIVLAIAAACLSAVAGVLDREEGVDTRAAGTPTVVGLAGAVLAILGYALPVAGSSEYAGPALLLNRGTSSWGLLVGLLAVLVATGIARYSRPARAAALLAGAACLAALRTAQWPLSAVRVGGVEPAVGWWFALLGTLVLAAAAGMVVAPRQSPRNRVRIA